MKKRILSVILTLAMVFSMVPAFGMSIDAEEITTAPVGNTAVYLPSGVTLPTGADANTIVNQMDADTTELGTTGETAWYAAEGELTLNGPAMVNGDVHLILADGCQLTIPDAEDTCPIMVADGSSLTIYGQSANVETVGQIIAVPTHGVAAVCPCGEEGTGNLIINGGKIDFTVANNDTIIVHDFKMAGGFLTANGDTGIIVLDSCEISGGKVSIQSVGNGIVSYSENEESSVVISDGDVNITGSGYDNGIEAQNVVIGGGKVTATGKNSGIYAYNDIIVSDGVVDVSGDEAALNAIGDVTISGGDVKLTQNDEGASLFAITSDEGNINVSGGVIEAFPMYGLMRAENGEIHITGGELVSWYNSVLTSPGIYIASEADGLFITIEDGFVSPFWPMFSGRDSEDNLMDGSDPSDFNYGWLHIGPVACSIDVNGVVKNYGSVYVALEDTDGEPRVDGTESEEAVTKIKLLNDTKEYIEIERYRFIELDLNGHTIDATGYDAPVITNYGWLKIVDSGETGVITGGSGTNIDEGKLTFGGGIYNGQYRRNGATLILEGGTITGNTADYGAGICCNSDTKLIINDVAITGNTATYDGGGIYCSGDMEFEMYGGSVTGNTAGVNGGGVTVDGLYLSEINSNMMPEYKALNTLTLGGDTNITGNTANSKTGNMYLREGQMIVISKDTPPTEDMKVGITLEQLVQEGTFVTFATAKGSETFYLPNFTSDEGYVINGTKENVSMGTFYQHCHYWTGNCHFFDSSIPENTITATCGGYLHDGETTETLTLNAPTLTVYGEEGKSEKATVSGDLFIDEQNGYILFARDTLIQDSNYKYYSLHEGYSEPGILDGPPTEAGNYKVVLTIVVGPRTGGMTCTASVEYTIAQAEPEITKEPEPLEDLVYTGDIQSLYEDGEGEGGFFVYAFGTDDKTVPAYGWTDSEITAKPAGTYYVWYYFMGDRSHTSTEPKCMTITIAPKTIEDTDVTLDSAIIFANGEEQTQKVNVNIADWTDEITYEVTNNKQTDAGTYTLTVNGTGNYTGTVEKEYTFFAKPVIDEEEDNAPITDTAEVSYGDGKVTIGIQTGEDAPEAQLGTSKTDAIFATATPEELAAVAAGATLDVWMEIDAVDLAEADPEVVTAVENAAEEAGIDMETAEIVLLDINLFKKLSSAEDSTAVTEANKPLTITITVPEALRSANADYSIIRIHEGVATVITGEYDPATGEFTFESDQFSEYALTVQKVAGACTYTTAITAGENMNVVLGGKEAGSYTVVKNGNGYQLTKNGKYVAVSGNQVVTDSSTAYTWKYDGGLYSETKTSCKNSFWRWSYTTIKTTKQYLTFDGEKLVLSTAKANAEVQVSDSEHTLAYKHNGDGFHEAYCTKCGTAFDKEKHSYDKDTHLCVCGKLDPDECRVTGVKVSKKKTTSRSGWSFRAKTTTKYQYTLQPQTKNVFVSKTEYSLNGGKTWKTGSCFTNDKQVSEFSIRITDSNGNKTVWLYKDGKVTANQPS